MFYLFLLSADRQFLQNFYPLIIVLQLVIRGDKQDVLRLQVCVGQLVTMQDCKTHTQNTHCNCVLVKTFFFFSEFSAAPSELNTTQASFPYKHSANFNLIPRKQTKENLNSCKSPDVTV